MYFDHTLKRMAMKSELELSALIFSLRAEPHFSLAVNVCFRIWRKADQSHLRPDLIDNSKIWEGSYFDLSNFRAQHPDHKGLSLNSIFYICS